MHARYIYISQRYSKNKKKIFYITFTFLLISCATSKKLNRISVGMSKAQAISILGDPASVSSPGDNQEFLNYRFSETDDDAFMGITTPYYVLIEYGKVKQYGRHGDFGVTQDPTLNINTTSNINTASNNNSDNETSTERMQKELQALKELLDDGILTEEEYNNKKKDILNKY